MELNQLQGPPELGPSPSMLLSRNLKEFGDMNYPFLSSPISVTGVKTLPSSSQREGQRPAGLWYQGLILVQMGNSGWFGWLGLKEPLLQNSQH